MRRKTDERAKWLEGPALPRLVVMVAAAHRLQAQDLAEVVQETRIAIWEANSEGRASRAWVLRVANNKAVDLVRARIRTRVRDRAFARLAPSLERDPDLKLLLRARVAQLPPHLREFFDQHYLQGWSEREIAARLGKCRASVRWLDHQLLATLEAISPVLSRNSGTSGHVPRSALGANAGAP